MCNVSEQTLDKAIKDKYIEPTRRKRQPRAGVEFELPIVCLDRRPVDFDLVHRLTDSFVKEFGFTKLSRDDEGDIYSAGDTVTGDILSFDCSYNTLELSFGAEEDLNRVYERFVKYYSHIESVLLPERHTLTGMGVNPYYDINRREPIPNGRYRMLFHHLSSYPKYAGLMQFHSRPDFGLFSCASQVQLDVEEPALARTLNIFTKLEPFKAVLFSNSLWGEDNCVLCGRDHFWRDSLHGLNPHNVDMYEVELTSSEDVAEYIKSMSIYCTERDGKYINFPPMPLRSYFAADTVKGEYYDGGSYRTIEFEPDLSDLGYLRSFKFEDVTYRGTVEFRSVCEQPVSEIMAPSAFHLGLLQELDALEELLDNDHTIYHRGYSASELRNLLDRRELPDFIDRAELSALLTKIVELAESGLKKRGLGEERFLAPLHDRAARLSSAGRDMADGLANGLTLEHFIEEYAKIER
ncbi:MAG: glutamylcysteine synthetase [Ruminococcus sp.]|nr:glutamylcysteine synthetase [Ruminococcus sp.]